MSDVTLRNGTVYKEPQAEKVEDKQESWGAKLECILGSSGVWSNGLQLEIKQLFDAEINQCAEAALEIINLHCSSDEDLCESPCSNCVVSKFKAKYGN